MPDTPSETPEAVSVDAWTKVIQIAVGPIGPQGGLVLFALCDDGGVWSLFNGEWKAIELPPGVYVD